MKKKRLMGIAAALAASAFAGAAWAGDEIRPDVIAEIESNGLEPHIVGTLPFAAFELFEKAGYLVYNAEARVTSPPGTVVTDRRDEEFTRSAGGGLANE